MDSNRVALATTNRKRSRAGGDMRGAPAPASAERVYFGSGSAAITGRFQRKLIRTAQWMQRNAGKTITVEGHANTTGVASVNQAISERRAEAVKRFLVGQGVEASRISTRGVGSERPEFQPSSSGKNRRVVIVVD